MIAIFQKHASMYLFWFVRRAYFCYNLYMEKIVRWYDKDPQMSTFMMLLESLSRDVQCEIAVDIMLNIPTIIDADLNDYVNDMGNFSPKSYNRWYDYNPTLHSAIEGMKELSPEQRQILISYISDIILKNVSSAGQSEQNG